MTSIELDGPENAPRQIDYNYPNIEVSWAGEDDRKSGFCFALEDSRLLFQPLNKEVPPTISEPLRDFDGGINGVAFLDQIIGVSTPGEVVFALGNGETAIYNGGAHGIISTRSGKFVAPLGPGGLLIFNPVPGESQHFKVLAPKVRAFNHYKVASLGQNDQGEIFVCALQKGGWATFVLGESLCKFSPYSHSGLDVVDVCSIASKEFPFAAIAVGIDRSLHLIKDVTAPQNGSTLSIGGLVGRAYNVLESKGNVILFTSESIVIFNGLARRFLDGHSAQGKTECWEIKIQAVDVSICYDRWLLVVRADGGVSALDLDDLLDLNRPSSTSPVASSAASEWSTTPVDLCIATVPCFS